MRFCLVSVTSTSPVGRKGSVGHPDLGKDVAKPAGTRSAGFAGWVRRWEILGGALKEGCGKPLVMRWVWVIGFSSAPLIFGLS